MKTKFYIWAFWTLLVFLGGCDQEEKNLGGLVPEDETIGIVNNERIPLQKFQLRFQSYIKSYPNLIPPGTNNHQDIKTIVINRMIEEELILQEASRKGIRVSKEELENAVEEALSPYPNANFDRELASKNLSKEQWKDRLMVMLLTTKLIDQEVNRRISISKRELAAYYAIHKNDLKIPFAVKVRNITLATESEAKALHQQIERGGDLLELIRQHSTSPDRVNDGDMGFIEKNEMPPEIESAIFALGPNKKISPPIHSQDGYHIFVWVKTQQSFKPSLEESKDTIANILVAERQDEAYAAWLERLKENATITIDQDMLKTEEGF
ncbi:MAG: hypothetical protein A2527_02225 [Candidatus Lambdaproteobacteria bacterium RIFOXYD2_FULL_50_16]|uniref:peptidylprolyl isomerase n=1 Tax=Candidatus Lambdaproteobacteria bacterium RIFOXYD2_FULL_50_16 TaxID=1817772 RepID=A0A1F6GDU5_9PROT|nr:MAG: hypothetical protein A2527_02225 [Candidatus Lambdaproteobacteria bacterium RIFOXYD2_FULL_50_16]